MRGMPRHSHDKTTRRGMARMKQATKTALLLALTVIAGAQISAAAQTIAGPATAPAGATAIPLYGKATPGSPADEVETRFMGRETVVRNITYPTLTPVFPAPGKANGTAVIVAPGGGFFMLSMQNEGWRVAQALAARGVTAFVLKYRLNPTPKTDSEFLASLGKMMSGAGRPSGGTPELRDPAATQDAFAALRMVRQRAAEWHIDPARVGMIGFSAGAMTTMNAVLQAAAGSDPLVRGPDFIGYIYGPMAQVAVPPAAPPMFAALAMDDPLFGNGDWSIATAWHAAKRPVELHVYQTGGHGFGMGKPGTTTTMMMDEFLAWMDMQGLLTAKANP
ncbi:MAG: alpha/beta hydrolase [Novosphingobium sp.]|nr:alpha/beta hydrolase [Novosphingobium sp.]